MIAAVSSINAVKPIYSENFSKINNDSNQQTNRIPFKSNLNKSDLKKIYRDYMIYKKGHEICDLLPFSLEKYSLSTLLNNPKFISDIIASANSVIFTKNYRTKLVTAIHEGQDKLCQKYTVFYTNHEDDDVTLADNVLEDFGGCINRILRSLRR